MDSQSQERMDETLKQTFDFHQKFKEANESIVQEARPELNRLKQK